MELLKSALRLAVCASLLMPGLLPAQTVPENIAVDAAAPSTPLPHFWEQMFGSGRAILSLRESYRQDLRDVKKVADFRYVRFHGILNDEVGVYGEDKQGEPIYNFTYVDQIYDGLLQNGVRPYVEIGFMPKQMAAQLDYHPFWYHPIVSPPKDYAKWDDLITQFARHLVDRYGIEEVSQWYFEVWNEPNIDFWKGRPAQETYFQLYDHTARAIKAVDPRLRVGGPSTAQAAWVGALIDHTVKNNVPLDFLSSHIYGDEKVSKVFHVNEQISRDQMVCRGTRKMHDEIAASARPNLPLIVSEFGAGFKSLHSRDSLYMGPWLADTIRQCDGLANMMSYWTFSDVFEEQGVAKTPFHGGFGLLAVGGIPKPSYNAFALMHLLGDVRIGDPAQNVLVTRRKDGTLVLAVWNLVDPGAHGNDREMHLTFSHVKPHAHVSIHRLDASHGDVLIAYQKMGSPRYPTPAQIQEMRKASQMGPPERAKLKNGNLTLDLPVNGLAVIQVK